MGEKKAVASDGPFIAQAPHSFLRDTGVAAGAAAGVATAGGAPGGRRNIPNSTLIKVG
jgi:hypothetical protein